MFFLKRLIKQTPDNYVECFKDGYEADLYTHWHGYRISSTGYIDGVVRVVCRAQQLRWDVDTLLFPFSATRLRRAELTCARCGQASRPDATSSIGHDTRPISRSHAPRLAVTEPTTTSTVCADTWWTVGMRSSSLVSYWSLDNVGSVALVGDVICWIKIFFFFSSNQPCPNLPW